MLFEFKEDSGNKSANNTPPTNRTDNPYRGYKAYSYRCLSEIGETGEIGEIGKMSDGSEKGSLDSWLTNEMSVYTKLLFNKRRNSINEIWTI